MATKKVNDDGTITWTYSSLQELADSISAAAENPYRLDEDLEAKDTADERLWGY